MLTNKILISLVVLLTNLFSLASNAEEDKFSIVERELQRLIGKVEILEHQIVELQKQTNKPSQSGEAHVSVTKEDQKQAQPQQKDLETADIFDIESKIESKDEPQTIEKSPEEKDDKATYEKALLIIKEKKYEEAEKLFADFIKNYSSSPLLGKALFWYGESFFQRSAFQKAALNFLKSYKQNPKGEKASDSLLRLAASLSKIAKTKEACSMIKKLETEFPKRGVDSMKKAKELKQQLKCE